MIVPIRLQVAGVLFHESIEEASKLIETCLSMGIRVHARVVHDDLIGGRKHRKDHLDEKLYAMVEQQEDLKKRGEKIHTSWRILKYQKDMLRGAETDWTCVGPRVV